MSGDKIIIRNVDNKQSTVLTKNRSAVDTVDVFCIINSTASRMTTGVSQITFQFFKLYVRCCFIMIFYVFVNVVSAKIKFFVSAFRNLQGKLKLVFQIGNEIDNLLSKSVFWALYWVNARYEGSVNMPCGPRTASFGT